MINKLYYGAAFYPELWDEKTIDRDIVLMKEAGINVVRMGEFAWSTMEPHKDEFNVTFFVEVIDKLYKNGIETIICTPTPTPPIWISHNHSERMIVDENNVCMVHGGRQQVCTNNDFLRERTVIIIEKMAKIYGNQKGVIGWQIDNELKGNVSECYCETCKHLWHQWLEKRYYKVENLNNAWGTHIWSQYYETFQQVPQPLKTPLAHSPSLSSAYKLFSRDLVSEFLNLQVDIIRKYSDLPITHNASMNHFIDNEKIFENLDLAAFDFYCTSKNFSQMLSHLDLYKTLKADKPFWLMETAANFSACGLGYQTVHNNGFIKAEVAAAYALGAKGFSYWLWRQQNSGIEQTHGHIISSWGERAVGFENVVEAGKLKDKLQKVFEQTVPVKAEIAITYSDRARVFFMTEPLENSGFNYVEEMMKWYDIVLNTGMHRDILFENSSFEEYKLLMTPYLPYISQNYINKAVELVDKGGVWIIGPITGTRTVEQTINRDFALGKLEELAGVKTLYHYPITDSGAIGNAFGVKAPLTRWSSIFQCINAKEVGVTEGGVTPDLPFITECSRGKGKIVMLGSMPSGEQGIKMLGNVIMHYAKVAGVSVASNVNPGTIVVPRKGKGFSQWVIINLDGKGGSVTIPQNSKDSFSGEIISDEKVYVEPYECKVIQY